MIGVIIGSRKMGINPDNVATPIAASLGDLITLALLSGISWGLYIELGKIKEVAWTSFLCCILGSLKKSLEIILDSLTHSPHTHLVLKVHLS